MKASIKNALAEVHTKRPKRVDFNQVKIWISQCESAHRRCDPDLGVGLRNLRVIDCATKEVVDALMNCAFVALSYVWGQACQPTHSIAAEVSLGFPITIDDSIETTKQLGYPHLWVDRYVCPEVVLGKFAVDQSVH